ncbi:MAG: NAD-dependent epimerase/dehydratase family protein, partial [bacterium]|nr:NAD-dependent epimerase/dehydratase family protein [bacterium]
LQEDRHPAPVSFYGVSKAAAETCVRHFGLQGGDFTIFRMFNIYGPGQNLENLRQGMASIYLAYLLRGEPILVKGSLDRYRDFLYIDDVVNAWLAAWRSPRAAGKTYNLGSGEKTTVRSLLNAMLAADGKSQDEYPVVQAEGTPGDLIGNYADISAIRQDLEWSPGVDLQEGLKRMIEWARSQPLPSSSS